jgi:hypothetical protein
MIVAKHTCIATDHHWAINPEIFSELLNEKRRMKIE